MIPPRFKNQDESIAFFREVHKGLDYSDAGTGKTRVQLDLFNERHYDGEGAALILAPKTILDLAWANDVKKFTPGLRTSIAHASNRAEAFERNADIYITNIDAVNWLVKQPKAFFNKFSTLIIDEITKYKTPTSQRSKAVAKISQHFKYIYGLTGTPDTNHILDLWHQVFIIDRGKRLGNRYYAFRNATCTSKQIGPSPQMVKWEAIPQIEEAIATLISDITIRHKLSECQDIPENFVTELKIDLTPKLRAAYDTMHQNAILEIRKDQQYISAVNAAALMTKLMQLASGIVYDEERKSVVLDDTRIELICDLVEQRNHSVVFFQWHHQRDALIKAFKNRHISFCLVDGTVTTNQVKEGVDRFQKGLYRVVLAQPQAAAHGLTLTKGTTTIWTGPTYNLEHYLQGNSRINRIGQTQRTETIMILANKTIDTLIYEKLLLKDKNQLSLLQLLEAL